MSDSDARQAGTVESYEGRGVWVPEGMKADEIMIGARVLEERFGIQHYEARSMVREVITALRSRGHGKHKRIDAKPKRSKNARSS